MDLWDVARVMWRRGGVTFPLLLLSAIAAVFALLTIPPGYTAKAQFALLPAASAQTTGAGEPANPFTVGTLAEFISISLNSPQVRQQMTRDGFSADYVISFKPENLALLGLQVTSREQETAAKTVDRLVQLIQAEVARLQSTLKPEQAITVSVVDRGEIRLIREAGMRALAVIMGVGLLVTAGVALVVDALVRRRSKPLARKVTAPSAAPPASAIRAATAAAQASVIEAPAVRVATASPAEAAVDEDSRLANAVTVLLEEASSPDTADNDVTVVLPLAGVARTSTKPPAQPGSGRKRKLGDAPDGAKTR